MNDIIELIQRIDLAYPKHIFGLYFHEVVALLAIVFGGAFLLFATKQFDYFRGIIGFLLGAWIGVFIKEKVWMDSAVSMVLFIIATAVLCAALFVFFKRIVGMVIGAFVMMLFVSIFIPFVVETSNNKYFMIAILSILGGTLGALFPNALFIFISSIIGASFVTYGTTYLISRHFLKDLPFGTQILLHIAVFVPLVIFGVLYQFMTSKDHPAKEPTPEKAKA